MGLKEKIEDRIKLEANSKKDFVNTMNSIGLLQWVLEELEKESDLKQEMLDLLEKTYNVLYKNEGSILKSEFDRLIQKAKESL